MGWGVKAAVPIKQDSSRNSGVRPTSGQQSLRGRLETLMFLFRESGEWIVAIAALFARKRPSTEHDIRIR